MAPGRTGSDWSRCLSHLGTRAWCLARSCEGRGAPKTPHSCRGHQPRTERGIKCQKGWFPRHYKSAGGMVAFNVAIAGQRYLWSPLNSFPGPTAGLFCIVYRVSLQNRRFWWGTDKFIRLSQPPFWFVQTDSPTPWVALLYSSQAFTVPQSKMAVGMMPALSGGGMDFASVLVWDKVRCCEHHIAIRLAPLPQAYTLILESGSKIGLINPPLSLDPF